MQIRKMNYVQSFTLDNDKNIEKKQEKLVILYFEAEQEKKLQGILAKNIPNHKNYILSETPL